MFERPVDDKYPVCATFLEWGERYEWLIDKDTGFWIPKGSAPGTVGQHKGIDFLCPIGTPVLAIADGIIIKAQYERAIYNDLGLGYFILQLISLEGYDSWWVSYGHLKMVMVNIGQKVRAGQPIAETGQSGNARYPILHVDLADRIHQFKDIPWKL